ncbi:MAG: hypothetical protein E6I57_10570 [Chloroflexi bacterium]|nr:MAG: hypothetical protein E6J49_06300 [Chloroflexota bacterium]TMB93725.1 MAG: hypothetical protein E6J38_10095 [Chloroflexota bacterium]TMC28667.1 MAG: hypothetical protein E6J27_07815 [Chloroflexota bacterium]TMC32184.1 MAG: hypothetical protein E6J24_14465 [Chloroflexota bacterium]TMC57292.1 MAG: hypothetical protein E6J19_06470 [Chloroflexota bacterium]
MSQVRLRIEFIVTADVDRALCDIGHVMLERCPEGVFVEVAEDVAGRARAALGRGGVSAVPAAHEHPAASALPGSALDLVPISLAGIVDRIWLRAIDLADATRHARRGILRRYDAPRVRQLLRAEDRAYVWRRVVWMPRSILRARELRNVRPIVFDRSALTDGRERWGFTLAANLARWLAA